MKIAVHRGGGAGPLQNTIRGIELAVDAGADAVEVDVHFSSDGVPFLRHDRWIDGRNVYEYSSQKLRALGLDALEDALQLFELTFYIDLKGRPTDRFLDVLEGDVIVGSFNGLLLQGLKETGLKTSLILSAVVPPAVIDEIVYSVGADYVNLGWEHHLPSNYLDLLHQIRTPVISWTENNEDVFKTLSGTVFMVMTDRLDLVERYGGKSYRAP